MYKLRENREMKPETFSGKQPYCFLSLSMISDSYVSKYVPYHTTTHHIKTTLNYLNPSFPSPHHTLSIFPALLSTILYEKRFGPYFCEPVVAGLLDDNTPFLSGMDLIGAPVFTKVCGVVVLFGLSLSTIDPQPSYYGSPNYIHTYHCTRL